MSSSCRPYTRHGTMRTSCPTENAEHAGDDAHIIPQPQPFKQRVDVGIDPYDIVEYRKPVLIVPSPHPPRRDEDIVPYGKRQTRRG